MKIDKLFDVHLLTGIVLGVLIGLHYPFEAYKSVLVILAVAMSLKVVTSK